MIEGLLDGTIDMIATDHAPHSAEEKSRGLSGSLMGVVGLETAFPVLYTHLVKPGILSLNHLVQLMSIQPRTRFGIPEDDSFSVWDLNTAYTIDPGQFLSRGRATPFDGMSVYGRCILTVRQSRIVWSDPLA